MDRLMVYPGAIPLDTDVLSVERNVMKALGWLAQATLGTGTGVVGLACNPTVPASMVVNIGPGALWAQEVIDQNNFGSLPADNSPLMKMGILPEAGGTNFTLSAPSTSGQSINYLIEAAFAETDTNQIVLPYVNPANPSQPFTGPNNSGTAQNTIRAQSVALQLKAGVAANTGTQINPSVDAGYVGLYVVTVNFGQATVTAANITTFAGAPFNGGPFAPVVGNANQPFSVGEATQADEAVALRQLQAATPISVKWFGAVGDGIADDFPAISAAVTAAVTAGGATVYYPPGLYAVSQSIPDVANVYHCGAGANATTVKATGDYPVFSRAGSDAVSINGGGVSDLTISGFWNQNPAENTNSHGLSIVGSNAAQYKNLVITGCFYGIYTAFNYESWVQDVQITGQGNQQNFGAVYHDAANDVNVNNAIYYRNVVGKFTYGNIWTFVNPNGSLVADCSAEASVSGWGFVVGSLQSLLEPAQFCGFVNCVGDSNEAGNWLIQSAASGQAQALQFSNCWSGVTENGPGWSFINVTNCTVSGCVSFGAATQAIALDNSPIFVSDFVGWNFNATQTGAAGVELMNTTGAVISSSKFASQAPQSPNAYVSVLEIGNSNLNIVTGNVLSDGATVIGPGSRFRNNLGFTTEAAAVVATIAPGTTSTVVTHSLSMTPNLGEITTTANGDFNVWITNINSTTFTLNFPAQTYETAIGWKADITRN